MDREVFDKVLNVFVRVFEIDSNELTLKLCKDDLASWDSIGHLQLIMNLEAEFGFKFKTDEIKSINTVEDCIKLIEVHFNN